MPIICEGCGRPVPIPDGHRRNKIQCACGVICAVPESARQETATPTPSRPTTAGKPPSSAEDEAECWLLDDNPPDAKTPDEPSRFSDPEPDGRPEPATKPAVVEMRFKCRRCRRPVRRQGECPSCDAEAMPDAKPAPIWRSVDEPDERDEEEDGSPYVVEGGEEVRCPKCSFMLPPGSVLCVRCGFHLTKRKKVVKTYQPIDRQWETNYTRQSRLTFFWICEIVGMALGLTGVFWGGAGFGLFIPSFLVLTGMLAFLLGTFDRIHLTRDARGRVRLTKTWRVCFFERQPLIIDVREYEGIVSGQHRDVSSMDYFILFFMVLSGLIPGLIWWYLAIYKVTFHASLCREHGFPERLVYSGWNQLQMKEVAYVLRDASGLHYDEG